MITITISVTEDGFFTNAESSDGSFVCTVAQPTLDLSLESAMVDVYRMAERELEGLDGDDGLVGREEPEEGSLKDKLINAGLIVAMVICLAVFLTCVWVIWGTF